MNSDFSAQEPAGQPRLSSDANAVEIVYSPRGVLRNGDAGWRIMIDDLANSRSLIWLLILRDVSVRYRQSLLGYVWALVPQIVTVGAFAALNAWRVVPMGKTAIPYVVYAAWGITVWQLFAGCLSACSSSLEAAGSLVSKISFPRECLVIASIGQPIFDFLVRLVPVLALFAWYGVNPSWSAVVLPLVLIPVILLAVGFGFILSIANTAIRDTGNAVGTALTVGLFLTPVLYPPPVRWPFTLINIANPLSPLLSATHDLIAVGSLTTPGLFAAGSVFAVSIFFLGWRAFRITILRVAACA